MPPPSPHTTPAAPARITILVDNAVNRAGLRAEHGWAVWIETGDRAVLFDTGQSDLVIANADALGLRFEALDAVVLSHGHYDHTGGLAAVLARARDGIRVYAHPAALQPKYRCTPAGSRPIGIPADGLAALHRPSVDLRAVEAPTDVAPGLWISGPVPRRHPEEVPEPGFNLDPAGRVTDPLDDDLALCLETPAGRVVVLGCAHRGVIATLDQVAALRPTARLQAVMGGMHLRSAAPSTLQWTVDALKHSGYERFLPAHCTGLPAVAALWAACPGQCSEAGVGKSTVAVNLAVPILALAAAPTTAAKDAAVTTPNPPKETPMRLAIPIADGRLSMHFGHCESFALIDVDPATKAILKEETLTAPPHEPGLLPRWLAEKGATVIIAGGMGQRAQGLFAEQGITVIVGAPAEAPQALAKAYLAGTLKTGSNVCDH